MRHSKIFDKIFTFRINVSNVFSSWKSRFISSRIRLIRIYLFPMVSFFLLYLWIPAENKTKAKKLFNPNRLKQNTIPEVSKLHLIFVSIIAVMQLFRKYFHKLLFCWKPHTRYKTKQITKKKKKNLKYFKKYKNIQKVNLVFVYVLCLQGMIGNGISHFAYIFVNLVIIDN